MARCTNRIFKVVLWPFEQLGRLVIWILKKFCGWHVDSARSWIQSVYFGLLLTVILVFIFFSLFAPPREITYTIVTNGMQALRDGSAATYNYIWSTGGARRLREVVYPGII